MGESDMKLTKERLKEIIKEELQSIMKQDSVETKKNSTKEK